MTIHIIFSQISEDVELMKQDIASDVEKEIASLRCQTDSIYNKKLPIRLQYIPPTNKGAKNSRMIKPIDGSLNVKDEIERLESIVMDLESKQREMRENMREEMERLGQNLNGVVCIPPMGKTK